MITFIYDVEQAGFYTTALAKKSGSRRDTWLWRGCGAGVARKKRDNDAFGVFTKQSYAPI